jgi:hypothetical protein
MLAAASASGTRSVHRRTRLDLSPVPQVVLEADEGYQRTKPTSGSPRVRHRGRAPRPRRRLYERHRSWPAARRPPPTTSPHSRTREARGPRRRRSSSRLRQEPHGRPPWPLAPDRSVGLGEKQEAPTDARASRSYRDRGRLWLTLGRRSRSVQRSTSGLRTQPLVVDASSLVSDRRLVVRTRAHISGSSASVTRMDETETIPRRFRDLIPDRDPTLVICHGSGRAPLGDEIENAVGAR